MEKKLKINSRWYRYDNGGTYTVIGLHETKDDPTVSLVSIKSMNSGKVYYYEVLNFLNGKFERII